MQCWIRKRCCKYYKKIIISIVLLGSTSTLFNLAFKAQDLIIDNQIIGKIIFNSSSSNGYDSDSLYSTPENSSTFGGRLSAEVFSAFYRLNPEASPKIVIKRIVKLGLLMMMVILDIAN